MVELPEEFRSTPRSYYVWSRSRRAAHTLALALGSFGDPAFRWLTVREEPSQPSEEEPWVRRLLPLARVLAPLSSDELGPGPPVSRESVDSLIRSGGTSTERTTLDLYLRLPPRLQELLDESDSPTTPRFVVVANVDRIRQLSPVDTGRLRPFTGVFSRHGLSLVATSVPPPYEGRYGFDMVLRLDIESTSAWRTGRLVVEKGPRSGEFRTGTTFSVDQLPWHLAAGAAIDGASG